MGKANEIFNHNNVIEECEETLTSHDEKAQMETKQNVPRKKTRGHAARKRKHIPHDDAVHQAKKHNLHVLKVIHCTYATMQ